MSDSVMQGLLEKDLSNASRLENLLETERRLLEKRDIGALNQLLMEKAQLLADIESNDDARRKLLASFGKSDNNTGLRDYCTQVGIGDLYKDLLRALQHCAELTNINGAIVHRSKLNNRHMLDIMQGKSADTSLYTQRGDASTSSDTRAIARA